MIKRYSDKAIIFLTKYCYCFSKSAEITMNQDFQFTWRKNISGKMSFYAISLYLFITILPIKITRLTRALWCAIFKQYCDKKIKQYCDKIIFFSSSCELKISIHGYFSWFSKAKAIFWPRKYCFINIALSFYCNIACENFPSDKGLRHCDNKIKRHFSSNIFFSMWIENILWGTIKYKCLCSEKILKCKIGKKYVFNRTS